MKSDLRSMVCRGLRQRAYSQKILCETQPVALVHFAIGKAEDHAATYAFSRLIALHCPCEPSSCCPAPGLQVAQFATPSPKRKDSVVDVCEVAHMPPLPHCDR